MTCMEAEKMVIPYINDQLSVTELEDFIDPDRTIILTLELGEGAAGAAAMAATSGAAVGTLPTPERSGYAFAGWYTAVDGGTAVTADTVFDANTTCTPGGLRSPRTASISLLWTGSPAAPWR